jgi:dynein heavy chain, axonemal
VPEAALNVTLQEDKYHRHIQDLKLMLTAYAGAVASLSTVETHLLRKQLAGLQVLH